MIEEFFSKLTFFFTKFSQESVIVKSSEVFPLKST